MRDYSLLITGYYISVASILTNAIVVSCGRVVNVLCGLVAIGLLTRLLGTEQFGTYTLLLSYGAILQVVADGGLYLTLTREISAHPDKEQHILSHTVSLRLILLAAAFMLGGVLTLLIPSLKGLLPAFSIAAVGLAFQSLSQLALGIYQKHGVAWRATIGDLVGRAVQIIGLLMMYVRTTTVTAALGILALSMGVTATVHQQLLPAPSMVKPSLSLRTWWTLLQSSWPLGALLVLNVLYFRIDIIIVSIFRSSSEVGLYGVAYRIVESGLFFPAMFGGLLLPYISRAWQQNKKEHTRHLIEQGLTVLLLGALFVIVVLRLYARPLIIFIAGVEYAAAASLLEVLSFALASMFLGNLFGFILVAIHRQAVLLKLYALLALVSVLANLVLIPHWGAIAAAWTTVVIEILATTVAAGVVWHDIRYKISVSVGVRLVLLALVTITVLLILPRTWHIITHLLVAAVVFGGSAVVVGLVRRDTISLLLQNKQEHAAL